MKLAVGLVTLALSISPTLAVVAHWGQCGGINYSGDTGIYTFVLRGKASLTILTS